MNTTAKPQTKPTCPHFSSGPCAKHAGWSLDRLKKYILPGRSHRSAEGKGALKAVIDQHREILGIPDDYRVAIVPASDTGAMEMAMWSMLGARPVDVFAWESFSGDWLKDVRDQLKLEGARLFEADYGQLPDLNQYNGGHDCVFAWNGTTSGVCVPHTDWIPSDRAGLTFCDATSGIFAYDLPWDKLDITTWSWQKVLGSEAGHGMLVLSPRAVERLESYTPPRPLPKIFRMTKNGKLNEALFEGATLNTPSLLAVADCLNALDWLRSIGGVKGAEARTSESLSIVTEWVESKNGWAEFLCADEASRSRTSICFVIKEDYFQSLPQDEKMPFIKSMCKLLDKEGVAQDLASYKTAPPGIRIWAGATVEPSDVAALLPWIEWAYAETKNQMQGAQAA